MSEFLRSYLTVAIFTAVALGLVEMGVFVGVLLLGLIYAWKKGVLRWV